MPLITSKEFTQYTWWRHLSSEMVFVVLEERKGFEDIELKILFEKKEETEWRTETTLRKLLNEHKIKQL